LRETVPQRGAVPGVVIAIQTFGDLLGFHPHCHVLCTDGCFYCKGVFRVAPRPVDIMVRKKERSSDVPFAMEEPPFTRKSKFEVYGEEMIEKEVKQSGNSGRVYLPPVWIGKHVKIIRIE